MDPLLIAAVWGPATWVTAYLAKVTAPQQCPTTSMEYIDCKESHAFHVKRNDTAFDLVIGILWPISLAVLLMIVFAKSVDKAAAATPMPKLKVPNTDKMLEAADAHFDQLKSETDKHAEELMLEKAEREKSKEKPVVYEATLVDSIDPYDTNPDLYEGDGYGR